jgi:hypothetical protein
MEQEIQKKVIKIANDMSDQIVEQTGIRSSLEEEDIKEYLNKTIEEIKDRENSEEKGDSLVFLSTSPMIIYT